MNILMVTPFYPPHIGGIEYHVENLSKQLAKKGHKITVLTSMMPGKKGVPCKISSDAIDVIRIKTRFLSDRIYPSLSSQGLSLNIRKTVERLVMEKHIDILHAHGHHYFLTWRAIEAAKSLGIPSVLTLHGLYALHPTDTVAQIIEEAFNRTIFKYQLNNVAAIIGLTPRITNYAKRYCTSSKDFFTIPNGVDLQLFKTNRKNRDSYRKKYGIASETIVVLFRGRLATIKGVLELAEAAKLVIMKNKKILFLFVGEGPLAEELARTLSPIRNNSKIIGWTPTDEIHELYLASDIFVLPSKSEALPLTILEAMAARLHIIATPVGGIPEVLQNYPFKTIINQATPSKICATILSVIAVLGKSFTGQTSESSYMSSFDWGKIAASVESVYQKVINGPKEYFGKDSYIQNNHVACYVQPDSVK